MFFIGTQCIYAIQLVVLWNVVSKSSRFRDIALLAYWGHENLTFQGHVTSSVT